MTLFAIASLPGLMLPVIAKRFGARTLPKVPLTAYGLLWCGLAVWLGIRPLIFAVRACCG